MRSADGQPALVKGWETRDANQGLRLYPRYVDEVQHGVELAAWRNGYALMLGGGNHENNEAMIVDIAGRVDGVIILPHTISPHTIQRISERIPVVIMSETGSRQKLSSVTVDNTEGVRRLVEHLLNTTGLKGWSSSAPRTRSSSRRVSTHCGKPWP